jgi:alkylation response protein AidB-like acyl-CoA dehydrogenase
MFQRTIHDFVEQELVPRAAEIDREDKFPRWAVEKMAELGLMGLVFPEEYGGAGGDYIMYSIAMEEVARASGSLALIFAAHVSLGTYPIFAFGNEEQKKKYLPDLLTGKKLGSFGLTEPGAGSDAGATKTRAVLNGDTWVVNGGKHWITNAGVAGTFVITARTSDVEGVKGISALIVEAGTPGLKIAKKEDKVGLRGSETNPLFFEDMHVPKENLLGEEGQGFRQFMKTLDGGRISIAAMALGLARAAHEAAVDYASQREQFGKPIAEFQGVQFKLANMATEIEAARHLVYSAARLQDRGENVTGEGTSEIQRIVIAREVLKEAQAKV